MMLFYAVSGFRVCLAQSDNNTKSHNAWSDPVSRERGMEPVKLGPVLML